VAADRVDDDACSSAIREREPGVGGDARASSRAGARRRGFETLAPQSSSGAPSDPHGCSAAPCRRIGKRGTADEHYADEACPAGSSALRRPHGRHLRRTGQPRHHLSGSDLSRCVRLIIHRGRLAAERVYFASHIEVLEPDDPERRLVAALCPLSHAVDTGRAGRADYDQDDAARGV
jgi:hypothetical protein